MSIGNLLHHCKLNITKWHIQIGFNYIVHNINLQFCLVPVRFHASATIMALAKEVATASQNSAITSDKSDCTANYKQCAFFV